MEKIEFKPINNDVKVEPTCRNQSHSCGGGAIALN